MSPPMSHEEIQDPHTSESVELPERGGKALYGNSNRLPFALDLEAHGPILLADVSRSHGNDVLRSNVGDQRVAKMRV